MKRTSHLSPRSPIWRAGCVAAVFGLTMVCAHAGDAPQSVYEKERARCLAGQSGQSQQTCLKEAGAARDAAGANQLGSGDANLGADARDRCNPLSGDQRRDCLARVAGHGSASGSVKAGGVIRETVTTTTRPAASEPASASAATAASASASR